MPKSSVFVIELNEFNNELLQAAVKGHKLPNLAKVLQMPCSHYRSPDRYNSGYLEPWVQWLSIHTGQPASTHHIKHLGDVPDTHFKQIWETLSEHHITTGVWGVMNGEKRDSKNTLFFLPDPWTFSEQAYPKPLNGLLSLPRYLAKDYLNLKPFKIIQKGFQLIKTLINCKLFKQLIKELPTLINAKRRFGKKHCSFICFFEYLSGLALIEYKKLYQPQVTFAFFNSLAHCQHHHWREGVTTVTPEILYGLQYIDKLLGKIFEAFPNDKFVIHNGLSQMNTNHEKPWVLYRQKDPKAFLRAMKIPFKHIEQHMTHDGHVFFDSPEDCIQSYHLLKQALINEQYLFSVELNTHDPCKLFYQLNYTDSFSKETQPIFEFNQKSYLFFDYFDNIVTRTGRHIPMGTVYSDTIVFPDQILNHEFNQYLCHYLRPDKFPLKSYADEFAEILEVE